MKGFKNTTRSQSGHNFPSDKGFSGSAGRVMVRPHSRSAPHYAKGGKVHDDAAADKKLINKMLDDRLGKCD